MKKIGHKFSSAYLIRRAWLVDATELCENMTVKQYFWTKMETVYNMRSEIDNLMSIKFARPGPEVLPEVLE